MYIYMCVYVHMHMYIRMCSVYVYVYILLYIQLRSHSFAQSSSLSQNLNSIWEQITGNPFSTRGLLKNALHRTKSFIPGFRLHAFLGPSINCHSATPGKTVNTPSLVPPLSNPCHTKGKLSTGSKNGINKTPNITKGNLHSPLPCPPVTARRALKQIGE